MQLVVHYTSGDGCTYCCEVNQPIVADSAEWLLVEIENQCGKTHKYGEFNLCGVTFNVSDFVLDGKFYAPTIFTVDEWFKYYKQQ